jgi:hypothetical protein
LCLSPGQYFRLNILDFFLHYSTLADDHLGPRIKAGKQPHLLLVDTAIEGEIPARATIE